MDGRFSYEFIECDNKHICLNILFIQHLYTSNPNSVIIIILPQLKEGAICYHPSHFQLFKTHYLGIMLVNFSRSKSCFNSDKKSNESHQQWSPFTTQIPRTPCCLHYTWPLQTILPSTLTHFLVHPDVHHHTDPAHLGSVHSQNTDSI